MAGGDDDLRISASLEGDLADALRRIEQRVDSLEGTLRDLGRTAEQAGGTVDESAREGAQGVDKLADASDRAGKSMSGMARSAKDAAGAVDDVGDNAAGAARKAGEAAAGVDKLAGELRDTARAAREAASQVDEAGDQAAESGAQAAAASTGWDKLQRAIERSEKLSRLYARAQAMQEWDAWSRGVDKYRAAHERLHNLSWSGFTAKLAGIGRSAREWEGWSRGVDKVRNAWRGVIGLDWGKFAKGADNAGKSLGGFKFALMGLKFGAIATGVWAIAGAISAAGAAAVQAVGGIASMAPALAAVLPIAVAAKLAMVAWKAAAEPVKDELTAIKNQYAEVGNQVAQGGLRQGLIDFRKLTDDWAEATTRGFRGIGKGLGDSTRQVGAFLGQLDTIERTNAVMTQAGTITGQFGGIAVPVLSAVLDLLISSGPAANRLVADITRLSQQFAGWMRGVTDSGAAAAMISQAYDNLRRTIGVLADWTVGLFNIFRIGAQEASWMGDSIERSAAKFRAFTESTAGQNTIRQFFVDATPAIKEAGLLLRDLLFGLARLSTSADIAPLLAQIRTELLPVLFKLAGTVTGELGPKLVDLATNLLTFLSTLDFNGLTIFVDALNGLLRGIVWISENVPGASWAISFLLTSLFLAGPALSIVGRLGKAFGALGTVLGWVAKLPGIRIIVGNLKLAWALLGGFPGLIGMIGRGILTAFSILGKGVIQAALWIGRGLAVAFLGSNPIGWIILAVVALVAAFWWCWENVDGFKEWVIGALHAIGDWFAWLGGAVWGVLKAIGQWFVDLWNNWLWPIISAIFTGLKWLGAILFVILVAPFILVFNLLKMWFTFLWENAFKPTLEAIGAGFVWLFHNVVQPVVDFFVWLWQQAVAQAVGMWENVLRPALQAIGDFFVWIFQNIIMPVVNFFVWIFQQAVAAVVWAWENMLRPALQAVGDFFVWIFNTFVRPAIDGIVIAWNALGAALRWVYDNLIVPMLNAFMIVINWLWLNVIMPVFAAIQAGWDALGRALAWVRDNVIQPVFDAVTNGLLWMRDRFTDAVNAIRDIWNGLRNALAAPVNFLIQTVWNKGILPAWNWVAEKLGLPLGGELAPIPEYATGGDVRGRGTGTSDSIPAMLSNGEHVWTAQEVRNAGGHENIKRLREMARAGRLAYFASGGPVTPPEMHALVAGALPGTRLTSGFRQGDPGWHGKNRAADLAGPRSGDAGFMRNIDQWIGTKFPGSAELIHTPGPFNIKNGSPHTYSASVQQDHYDHVHWANNGSAEGEGGGGFLGSMWDMIAKPALDGILNPIIDGIPFHGPPEFMNIPKGMGITARDSLYDWAKDKLNAITDFVGNFTATLDKAAAIGVVKLIAAMFGWGSGSNWDALFQLVGHESGWDPNAQNPASSAAGLFQKMQSVHGPVENSIEGQAMWGLNYIKGAYGNPSNAWAKWQSRSPHWYDDGGYLPPGLSMVMNGTGQPEPVFTAPQWDMIERMTGTDDLVAAMHATPPSVEARAASARDDALAEQLAELTAVIAERPPALAVSGDDIRREVMAALAADRREREARARHRYE